MARDRPDNLDAYMGLAAGDISRLVLCLLIEEHLQRRLAAFRQDLPPQPVEGLKELGVIRGDIVLVGDALR